MVHFWICTSLSPNSTGSENILIDKCSSTLFFLILLLLLKSEIKLSFDTLDLVKKCHISLQQQLLLKKLLAITRKIAGAWKSKTPQKLATPTIIKKYIYHRCPAEGCHFQNLIQLNQNKNGNPHSADDLNFVCTYL